MKTRLTLIMALAVVLAGPSAAQQPPRQGGAGTADALLKKFDRNGDGKLDDEERRAAREALRRMRTKPGATTPSGRTETIGNRDVTEMEYASSDGRKIPCVLSMPKGDGPFPVLVTIHGGQGDRDLGFLRTMAAPNTLSPTIAALNGQPWAILAISFRSGNGALFGMEQDDVIAGIRFAKALPKVDPARVGVIGGSHGGHLALVAAERMGKEFLCVAALSPWMTDPVVYMTGDPAKPPLSLVRPEARDELVRNGRTLFRNLTRGRGMSEQQARAFLAGHSVEANAHRIAVPSLVITSRGDDQAPHALIEPTIQRMKAAGQDVTVYTAEKSPHGFYWARTVSAARALRGEKSAEEAAEERVARETIIAFFTGQFARKDAGAAAAPTDSPAEGRPAVARSGQASREPSSGTSAPIRISTGELVGEQRGEVRVYRGIPYAAPPVGELRWKPPQPPAAWTGVREALAFGAPALQSEAFVPRSEQREDCLFLNVWAPAKAAADAKLPVLVWIHGGAFIQGSGAQPRYDGRELARRGAVVVTINYRLGPMGLFAHPTLTAEARPGDPLGNFCLLDMVAALRWTRENIAAFGGDPGNVTISGSSAGGTSCLFLMGIPEARGLFHKAIIHSSGGIRNIQSLAEAEASGMRLADRLGIGPAATAADLRRVRADDVAVGAALIRQLDLPVKPVVDGRLVAAVPADTFAQGKQARVPVLMGAANGESGARQLGDDVATGGAFGFQRQLADHMVRVGQPVYLFQLTFVPPRARARRSVAMHGESVAYAFGTVGQPVAAQYGFRSPQAAARASRSRRGGSGRVGGVEDDVPAVEDSSEGRKISEAMMAYWVSFMRDGRPAGTGLPEWPAYTTAAPRTLVFGNSGIAAR